MDKDKTVLIRWAGVIVWGFVLASFIGWIYEEICTLVIFHQFTDRGFLWLPLCPIYGFGGWLLYLCLHKIKNPFVIVLAAAVISGVYEYACSYVLEKFFNTSLWSYALWVLSINGRISLLACLFFGLFAALFIKLLVPLLQKLFEKIPSLWIIGTSVFAVVLIIFDALNIVF